MGNPGLQENFKEMETKTRTYKFKRRGRDEHKRFYIESQRGDIQKENSLPTIL